MLTRSGKPIPRSSARAARSCSTTSSSTPTWRRPGAWSRRRRRSRKGLFVDPVVIGASPEQRLCALVCAHTVRKHASIPFNIVHSFDRSFPVPSKPENRSRTGFSFIRFAIPEMTGYQGRGMYLECDQIVFRDVAEIFGIPFGGSTILRPPNQASVLLLDCDRLRWRTVQIGPGLDDGKYGYRDLMEDLACEDPGLIQKTIP